MRWRWANALAFGLSAALVLSIAASAMRDRSARPSAGRLESVPVSPITNAEVRRPGSASARAFPPFLWSDIASADLRIYRDNLRAVGCPELTIREILKAEINERFGARRRAIMAGLQDKFWERLGTGEWARRQQIPQTDWGHKLQELAEERSRTLRDVLGTPPATADAEALAQRQSQQQRLAWLPPEKRDALIALEENRQQQMALTEASAATSTNSIAEQEARLQQAFEDSKRKLLTAEELDELRLRDSDAANWPTGLAGFEPTEAEWRAVTRLKLDAEAAEANLAEAGLTEQERTAQQQELEATLAQNIKEALGPDRYAEYELAADGRLQSVRSVVRQFGLSDQLVPQVDDVQRGAQAEAEQVSGDDSLSAEARQAALAGIRQKAEQRLKAMLGDNAFSAYAELSGNWLVELSP
jgi:hypothetical protein